MFLAASSAFMLALCGFAVAAPVQDDSEVIAVIAAAVAALGHSAEQIACVRRLPEASWTQNAHIEAISVRKECF